MKIKRLILFISLLIFFSATAILVLSQQNITDTPIDEKNTISIAAWNLQVFGKAKAENNTILSKYTEIIKKYDIIFIQEIRDKDNVAFPKLCSLLSEYECFTSSRSGRTSYKEEYGVIYKKNKINIGSIIDLNPDPLDRWERPPLVVKIKTGNENSSVISIYVLHAKPSDVSIELANLYALLANSTEPIIVLGDLNADCSFFQPENTMYFKSWYWIINNSEDTTTGRTDCAYDRIIMNNYSYIYYSDYGIDKNVTSELSDHYLIWVSLSFLE